MGCDRHEPPCLAETWFKCKIFQFFSCKTFFPVYFYHFQIVWSKQGTQDKDLFHHYFFSEWSDSKSWKSLPVIFFSVITAPPPYHVYCKCRKKKLGRGSQLAQQVSLRRAWCAWWKERTVPTIGFLTDNASSHTINKCIFFTKKKIWYSNCPSFNSYNNYV